MMYEQIDRPRRKQEAAELLRTAQVSPKAMTALYLSLVVVLNLISSLGGSGFFSIFISILKIGRASWRERVFRAV